MAKATRHTTHRLIRCDKIVKLERAVHNTDGVCAEQSSGEIEAEKNYFVLLLSHAHAAESNNLAQNPLSHLTF